MSSIRKFKRGFTLLEVMVALVIIGLSLVAISEVMLGMLDNGLTLRERTYASWIAQNKIVEMRAAGVTPEVDTTSGIVTYANTEWEWVADVSETGIDNLWRVDVTVISGVSGAEVRTVTGFIGEPTPPGFANNAWSGLGGQNAGNRGATK